MDVEDLQDVAQLRVIVTMKEGHDSTLYGTGVLRACPCCVAFIHLFIHYTPSNPQIRYVAADILRQPSSLPCLGIPFSTM